MLFLIEYDRTSGTTTAIRRFAERDLGEAAEVRLQLELSLLPGGLSREVVLLEASTEEALRQTHRRYFEHLSDLAIPST